MLAIELELLSGRYVATQYNDRSRGEWPPHPARLFSALVATHYGHEPVLADERLALEWLERQPPPHIAAALPDDVAEREPYSTFVPVNDSTVVGSFDDKIQKLEDARAAAHVALQASEGAPKRGSTAAKALAQVERLQKSLADDMQRSLGVGKVTEAGIKEAKSVVPESRLRQPRTFPSIWPRDPVVQFVWPEATATQEVEASLEGLASRLVRLGHSSSLVRARLTNTPKSPTWRPDDTGECQLRVVASGQLEALDAAWALHRETLPRVLPATFQAYTTRAARSRTEIPGSHFGSEWLILRRTAGPALPTTAGAGLAATIRRALMKFAAEPVPEVISGHGPDGGPSQRPHLAIVPLPFVGHQHADGTIVGVALVLPADVSDAERRLVHRALSAWAKSSGETSRIAVFLGAAGTMDMERVDGPPAQVSLQPTTWCRPALRWVTATPIALDRNPGDLWSRDPREAVEAEAEAVSIIRASAERIGLNPGGVTPLRFAPLAGGVKVRRFPRFPQGANKLQRILVHAELSFDVPVRGPILLGAGRYLGLGLLRPASDHG